MTPLDHIFFFFFFNDTATTEIYTLSLHDALPICHERGVRFIDCLRRRSQMRIDTQTITLAAPASTVFEYLAEPENLPRSEEHTSELQSQSNLVCRLLLEKKKNKTTDNRRTEVQRT